MKIIAANKLLAMMLIGALCCLAISCSEDKVEGCTDPDSLNFNTNATEDDGTCTYPRDNFIGDYEGDFTCAGAFSIANTEGLLFSLNLPTDPNDTNGVEVNFTSGVITGITIRGEVAGNVLTIPEQVQSGFPFMGLLVDLRFSGSFVLDGNDFDGSLTIAVVNPFQEDVCTMDAVKL